MIKCAVVGHGYWGRNLVRNVHESRALALAAVVDSSASALASLAGRYPNCTLTSNYKDVLDDPKIRCVLIATPVSTHHELALAALRAGKHVLVEKPICANSDQALELVREAQKRKLQLLVDHTFLFTSAVRKIRDLVSSGFLGQIYYYDSERVNLGLFQHDVNVIWDLAVHDLSIMDFVLGRQPVAVSATGVKHVADHPEDMAFMTLFYDDTMIAHLNVNWLAPVKLRRTLIGGSERMLVYDDLAADEKIKIYDKGVRIADDVNLVHKLRLEYRTGDAHIPKLENAEALAVEMAHLAACIDEGARPICDGTTGLRIVRILEAATESMARRGVPVELRA